MHTQSSTASETLSKPTGTSLLPPAGTMALCLLTIGTSIAESIPEGGSWTQAVGVVPASVLHLSSITSIGEGQVIPVWLTLCTYVFVHGGWWHVLPNMAGLWVFGAIAEPALGTRRFVLTYLAFGVVGAFGIGLVLPHSMKPVGGASLAISGILGVYSALRLSRMARSGAQSILLLLLEAASVLGVAAWLVFRTVPAEADLTCSIMYHFIPFLVAWLSVRAFHGLRRLGHIAHGRAA
jgi:membrane associated rhomboid family serine protease